jgi:hypothetical protein
MGVRMAHHAAVGHHMHVLMLVSVRRIAVMHVAMVMEVIMLASMLVGGFVLVPVRVPRLVLMSMLVRMLRLVGMGMTVDRPVRMHVLVLVAFDLRFAAAATAGCAHFRSPRRRVRRPRFP